MLKKGGIVVQTVMCLLSNSRRSVTGLCPEPDAPNPDFHTLFINTHLDITLSPMPVLLHVCRIQIYVLQCCSLLNFLLSVYDWQ